MLKLKHKEKRKYERYSVDARIYFHIKHSLKTKVKFCVLGSKKNNARLRRYSAVSRDISAEGLGFSSSKSLKKGNQLYLEVYLPEQSKPVLMVGEVRWSKPAFQKSKNAGEFNTGVKVATVNGKSVRESIHYDERYKIVWSIILESIFGNFRKLIKKRVDK